MAAQLAALKIQPLRYADAVVPIPNYERRDPAPKLQAPLSTTEAAKHIQIPPGFELQLFAAEPLITGNPEAMAWDERGRLWIAETKDYPNNPQPTGQGNDVIKILEDTNRDGRADKATIFADKLTIVSSLVFANGGAHRLAGRRAHRLKDTNGDDKADLRESLITGWSMRDTHALASNLKYGLDNWIWGAVGYSGFNGTVGGKALNFNQALYRFSRDAQADGAHGELHEQHVGARLQRDGRRVRLDRQRRAQRVRRDSAAVLPGRDGPERRRQEEDRRPLRDAGEHAEDPAGGRAGRVHGGGGTQLLHGARVPARSTGTASPS